MNSSEKVIPSQLDLIVERFLAKVGKHDGFNQETIQNLREIAANGQLSSKESIFDFIEQVAGVQDENS